MLSALAQRRVFSHPCSNSPQGLPQDWVGSLHRKLSLL